MIDCKPKGNTVLVVDDEPLILDIVSLMLENHGFAALAAVDGEEGIKLFEKHRQEIFLVLCDLNLSGMDGWQIISALHKLAPGLPVVLVSGCVVDQDVCREHSDSPWAIMNKPYVFSDLDKLLQRALQERESTP